MLVRRGGGRILTWFLAVGSGEKGRWGELQIDGELGGAIGANWRG